LTDAALIAEFETDQQVVEDILAAVKDGRSTEHVAQRARDARERQQVHDETVAALTDAGVTVIDRPEYTNKTIKELRDVRLVAKSGAARSKAPTQAEHASCPGHAAYVTVDSWSTTPQARTTYVCTDPAGNGHAVHSYAGTTMPGESPTGPMSEEQKAQRRTLIANNKAWDAAEKVRRAWIADALLTRTSAPKDAEAFLARAVVHGEHTQDGNRLYTTLTTGRDDDDYSYNYEATQRLIDRADAATPRQALMLALALLVCEWESGTSRNTWRHPSERDRRYLTALIQWGYQPSEVEQLILTPGGSDLPDSLGAPEDDPDGEPGAGPQDDLNDGRGFDDSGAPVELVHEDNDTQDLEGECDPEGAVDDV
jgi:ParB family chromosome partitioning protein